ncbi:hypothetical protein EF847_12085 [Actinobacteria bacterium YIM 96077]|uniref:Glycoside hydrolase family 15 n=1 Tax=Phytoactinopolyspora halophila TaxID=1981511 RepID=A0A329QYF6_9ACTN|nr:hypothetical protein [Phytoactinopolyspora halophila]AYY13321.1 hypothetical protein EF847_12085 [Actinobacteria bacterium YIM 96077]RAW17444.1 hypothetical protein DPM12_05345 [Phytoactinopolyspora halophila]
MSEPGHEPAVLGTRGTAWAPETRLYSDGVVVGKDGEPLVVPPHSGLARVPGTGYLDPVAGSLPGAHEPAPEEVDAWTARLEGAAIPGVDGPYSDMARTALADIEVLTFPNGAAVAAGSPYWRFVWPRDTGFMAVALSLTGRTREARRLLDYVARMQEDDGGWQARYLPDGSGDVPDGRGRQLDGIGWTLWATWFWQRTTGDELGDLGEMAEAATRAALDALDPATHLPTASQDYWEMDVDEVTLGTAAPLLLGLRCAHDLLLDAGASPDAGDAADTAGRHRTARADLAARAARAASGLDTAIHTGFGAHGYRRRFSGSGGYDASVAFLLPPFAPLTRRDPGGVADAWRRAVEATTVANGGVRPGEEWTDLMTAWTPQVSLHALAAAGLGDTALAHRLLSWLDVRRTGLGSLPEKVTEAGRPAAVAPLGLTGATVLIALAVLEGTTLPVPGHGRDGTEGGVRYDPW